MTPFLIPGSRTFKVRIRRAGKSAALSTGTRDPREADDIAAVVDVWLGRVRAADARPDVIDALLNKRLSLKDAYLAHLARDLDRVLREAGRVNTPPVDLHPLVKEWHTAKQAGQKGAKSAGDYLANLRRLYPAAAPFTLDTFTRAELARRLDTATTTVLRGKGTAKVPVTRPVSGPTKNRYRAAASSFAWFLVERGIMERNFVLDIRGFGEHEPRCVYYERADVKKLLDGMPQPVAAAHAFAAAFCAEWTAIVSALVGDFDTGGEMIVARVRGTKTRTRAREVPLVAQNRWLWDYIAPALKGKLPDALAFAGVTEMAMSYWLRKLERERGIAAHGSQEFGPHNIQDWRHTHTVQLIRDGFDYAIAAKHLGHANTHLTHKVYGRFKPDRHDYAKPPTPPRLVTTPVTTAKR